VHKEHQRICLSSLSGDPRVTSLVSCSEKCLTCCCAVMLRHLFVLCTSVVLLYCFSLPPPRFGTGCVLVVSFVWLSINIWPLVYKQLAPGVQAAGPLVEGMAARSAGGPRFMLLHVRRGGLCKKVSSRNPTDDAISNQLPLSVSCSLSLSLVLSLSLSLSLLHLYTLVLFSYYYVISLYR